MDKFKENDIQEFFDSECYSSWEEAYLKPSIYYELYGSVKNPKCSPTRVTKILTEVYEEEDLSHSSYYDTIKNMNNRDFLGNKDALYMRHSFINENNKEIGLVIESDFDDDDDIDDEELGQYSEKVQKRLNKLKYEYHEERRQREAAERMREEAVRAAQQLANKTKEYESLVSRGEAALIEQIRERAQLSLAQAKDGYRKAYEEGDADAMAVAQEELSKAVLAEQSAGRYAQSVQSQFAQQYQAQQPQVQEPQLDPDMQAWSSKNPWFMNNNDAKHAEMTSYALTVDQRLRNQGIRPEDNSAKYYEEVDNAMRREYPDFFGVEPSVEIEEEAQTKQPSNVVAPASRSTGGKTNPRSIRLTQTQVKLARQLGVTPEQYAKQLLKES